MGEHVDTKKYGKRNKKGFSESVDPALARRRRVTFKNYLREVKEEFLETDLKSEEDDDPAENEPSP